MSNDKDRSLLGRPIVSSAEAKDMGDITLVDFKEVFPVRKDDGTGPDTGQIPGKEGPERP